MERCQEDQTEERLFLGWYVLKWVRQISSKSTHSSQTTGFTANGLTETLCLSRKSQFIDCTFSWYNGTFVQCVSQLIACFTTCEATDLHLDVFLSPKSFPPCTTWCPHAADLNICCVKHWRKTFLWAPVSFLASSAKQMLVGRSSHSFKWCYEATENLFGALCSFDKSLNTSEGSRYLKFELFSANCVVSKNASDHQSWEEKQKGGQIEEKKL